MTSIFDEIIDRHGTGSLKYDCAEQRGRRPELTPLWVADMDFRAPRPALDALVRRVEHGIFGYTEPTDAYFDSARTWMRRHHGWAPEQEWFTLTPGVVYALACAVRAFTKPGEGVLIQQPVYYPFSEVIRDNGRKVVNAPLALTHSAPAGTNPYRMDFDALEHALAHEGVRLYLLCNPHNPVGRSWTPDELRRVGELCLEHDVTVVSDEIHADLVRPGVRHVAFASLDPAFAQASVTCTSASKTFNLAGLQVSNVVIPNERLRERFRAVSAANGYSQVNALGLVASEACYREGEPWLEELRAYLDENFRLVRGILERDAPDLRLIEPESTYLAWVDCRKLEISDEELTRRVEEEAGLWLDMGDVFGPDGSGFVRINVACPRSVLADAVSRLARLA